MSAASIGPARYIRYSLRLRRVEYRVAELPIFLIPVLLTVTDAASLAGVQAVEGLFIFFFLFALGDLVNCLTDRDLDAIYKPHLTEAVQGIGVRGVLMQAVGSAAAALALAAHLSWREGRWSILAMTAAAVVAAPAYSAEPLRLKRRGLGQLAFYWLGLFAGPMILSALFFVDRPSAEVWAVALSYGLLQTGVILINTAEDFPEDRQMGVRTAIVALGLERGMSAALGLSLLGSAALLGVLGAAARERGLGPWACGLGLGPLGLACALVVGYFVRLRRRVAGRPEEDAVAVLRGAGRLAPLCITSIALGTLGASIALFLARR